MDIFEQLSRVISDELACRSASEIGKDFSKHRDTIFSYENGMPFVCDPAFVRGLMRLGYRIVIEPRDKIERIERR